VVSVDEGNTSLAMQDTEHADFVLEGVEADGEYVTLTFDGGLVTGYRKNDVSHPDFVPKAGQTVRFYGKNAGVLGGSRRGLMIDGLLLQYRTEEEDRAHHRLQLMKSDAERQREYEKNAGLLEEKLDALPIPYRARVTYYLEHNPDFYWKYLAYELSVCQDASRLAQTARRQQPDEPAAWVEDFHNKSYDEQMEIAPWMSDGHSGNSFGFVVRLAHIDVSGGMVELEHGALCPLVGCKAYGCRLAEGDED
jgi:hypothetical protein